MSSNVASCVKVKSSVEETPRRVKTRGGQRVDPGEPCARDQPRPLPHPPSGHPQTVGRRALSHLEKVNFLLLNAFRRTRLREPAWCPIRSGVWPRVAHFWGAPSSARPPQERRGGEPPPPPPPRPASGAQRAAGSNAHGKHHLAL